MPGTRGVWRLALFWASGQALAFLDDVLGAMLRDRAVAAYCVGCCVSPLDSALKLAWEQTLLSVQVSRGNPRPSTLQLSRSSRASSASSGLSVAPSRPKLLRPESWLHFQGVTRILPRLISHTWFHQPKGFSLVVRLARATQTFTYILLFW